MFLLKEYLSSLDGSTDAWDKHVERLIPQVFHKDVKFLLNDEESLDYDEIIDFVKSFIAQGNKTYLIEMKPLTKSNQLLVTTRNSHEPDEILTKLATYQDSKIIRLEKMPENSKRVL